MCVVYALHTVADPHLTFSVCVVSHCGVASVHIDVSKDIRWKFKVLILEHFMNIQRVKIVC